MSTNQIALNMLVDLLESEERLGPTVRVSLERVTSVLRGVPPVSDDTEVRRRNALKTRYVDGLRAASADELDELARGTGTTGAALRRAIRSI